METAGAGRVACFVTPAAKSPYGRRKRSATAREIDSISRSSVLVHDQLEPGCARDQLDGAVVVRRAQPAGDEAGVCLQSLAQNRLELGRRISRRS